MNPFKVKVPGIDFEISSNQIYHIREVSDKNAPDGYQRKGISKHPLPGIEQGIIVPYHESTKTWDTGFNRNSFCYSKESPKKADEILKTLKKEFIPQLSSIMESDLEDIRSTNDKFFDEFIPFNGDGYGDVDPKFKIKGGNMFNTSKPLELLALWFALLSKQVMPPSEAGNMAFKGCTFILEDKKQTTSVEQDKSYSKMEAVTKVFSTVKAKNKKEISKLQNIFTYAGLNLDMENLNDKTIISTFTKWAESGGYNNENSAYFNEVYDYFEDKENEEELIVYVKLLKDIKESKVKIERQDIFFEKKNLGMDKKEAAKKIVADQELHKAFLVL